MFRVSVEGLGDYKWKNRVKSSRTSVHIHTVETKPSHRAALTRLWATGGATCLRSPIKIPQTNPAHARTHANMKETQKKVYKERTNKEKPAGLQDQRHKNWSSHKRCDVDHTYDTSDHRLWVCDIHTTHNKTHTSVKRQVCVSSDQAKSLQSVRRYTQTNGSRLHLQIKLRQERKE